MEVEKVEVNVDEEDKERDAFVAIEPSRRIFERPDAAGKKIRARAISLYQNWRRKTAQFQRSGVKRIGLCL